MYIIRWPKIVTLANILLRDCSSIRTKGLWGRKVALWRLSSSTGIVLFNFELRYLSKVVINRRPFDIIVRGSVGGSSGVVASLHALSLYAPKPLIGLNAALFTAWKWNGRIGSYLKSFSL